MMNFLAIACLAVLATVAAVSGASQSGVLSVHSMGTGSRIVNGQDAVPNAFPYQIALQYRTSSFSSFAQHCGASIINELWLLTAAHCNTELPPNCQYQASAGRHKLRVNEAHQQDRAVVLWVIHPSYEGGVNPHDIALIKVESPFNFNDAVQPISLPNQDFVHSGNVVLSGWGSTSRFWIHLSPTVLQTVTIPLIDTGVCYDALIRMYTDVRLFPETLDNVCTGPLDDSRISACRGDSGGPLAQQVEGSWELVGIVSWGAYPCGRVGAPSVFVRTSAYRNWIDQQIAAN